ncbi:MAG TPA: hypothetical protein PKE29_14465 [Phycisphaerales bacterium]|nr:hypothetical protein [Phycisphaerales bacterium]
MKPSDSYTPRRRRLRTAAPRISVPLPFIALTRRHKPAVPTTDRDFEALPDIATENRLAVK